VSAARHAGRVAVGDRRRLAARPGGCIADVAPADATHATLATVARHGRRGWADRCDVMSPDAVQRFGADVPERFGRCEILVNNAGVDPQRPFADLSHAEWRNVFAVNVDGAS